MKKRESLLGKTDCCDRTNQCEIFVVVLPRCPISQQHQIVIQTRASVRFIRFVNDQDWEWAVLPGNAISCASIARRIIALWTCVVTDTLLPTRRVRRMLLVHRLFYLVTLSHQASFIIPRAEAQSSPTSTKFSSWNLTFDTCRAMIVFLSPSTMT